MSGLTIVQPVLDNKTPSTMNWRRLRSWPILALSLLAGIGDALGSSWHHVIKDFSYVGYAVAVVIVVTIVALFIHRLQKVRAERTSISEV